MAWLVVIAAVNTVASVFYYLRWLAPAFLRVPADSALLAPAGALGKIGAYSAALGTLGIGVAGRLLLDLAPTHLTP